MITRRYGLVWEDMDDLQIEISCIRKGGKWKMGDGKEYGEGMFAHFRRMQSLLWPEDDHHRGHVEERHDWRALHRRPGQQADDGEDDPDCGCGLHHPGSSDGPDGLAAAVQRFWTMRSGP